MRVGVGEYTGELLQCGHLGPACSLGTPGGHQGELCDNIGGKEARNCGVSGGAL